MEKSDRLAIRSLTVAAWLSGLLCFVGLFLIFAIWFLVPNDPGRASGLNIMVKLKPIAVIALLIALFALASKSLFTLRDRRMQVD
jgi:Na+/proline symporter